MHRTLLLPFDTTDLLISAGLGEIAGFHGDGPGTSSLTSENPGDLKGSMQHPLKPAQNVDFLRPSIRQPKLSKKGPRVGFYDVRTLKGPKPPVWEELLTCLVVLHRPVEPARNIGNWLSDCYLLLQFACVPRKKLEAGANVSNRVKIKRAPAMKPEPLIPIIFGLDVQIWIFPLGCFSGNEHHSNRSPIRPSKRMNFHAGLALESFADGAPAFAD